MLVATWAVQLSAPQDLALSRQPHCCGPDVSCCSLMELMPVPLEAGPGCGMCCHPGCPASATWQLAESRGSVRAVLLLPPLLHLVLL